MFDALSKGVRKATKCVLKNASVVGCKRNTVKKSFNGESIKEAIVTHNINHVN